MMTRRRDGGRRWRYAHHADPGKGSKRTAQQLALTIVALVFLIAFWTELSSGAAGCFTKMTAAPEQTAQPAPQGSDAERGATPATRPERDPSPSVRIELPPPRPVDAQSR